MQQVTLVAILTKNCNNQCLNCVRNPSSKSKDKIESHSTNLSLTVFERKILSLSKKVSIKQAILTGGEPLLLNIEDYLLTLTKANIKRVHIQTNGTLINNKINLFVRYKNRFHFSFLVSVYGTSKEEYENYTKSNNWEKVWYGIEKLKLHGFPYQIGIISSNITKLMDFPIEHEYIAILPHREKLNKILNWIIQLREIINLNNIYIEGLPPCFFPKYYFKFVSLKWPKQFIIIKPTGIIAKAPPFDYMYKNRKCYKCIFNKLCPGIYKEYSPLLKSIISGHPLLRYS